MPTTTTVEPGNIHVFRVTGLLKRSEFAAAQRTVAEAIDAGAKPKYLTILENFEGWEKGADWNDLDFMLTHGNQIAKIAIVGEPRWEAEALAFAGAGFRSAPVKYFRTSELAEARSWLAE